MRAATATLGSFLLASYALWPLPLHAATHLPRAHEADPYLASYAMGRFLMNLSDPETPLWYGDAFAPEENTLAFTDPQVGPALAAAPVLLATKNPAFAFNLCLFAAAWLSGLSAYALARRFADSAGAAFAAAAFVLAPIRNAHIRHLQLYWTAFLPLLFLVALRLRDAERRRVVLLRAAALFSALILQGLFGIYFYLFALPLLAVVLSWKGKDGAFFSPPFARAAGLAACALSAAPLYLLYSGIAEVHAAQGFAWDPREVLYYSARPRHYFVAPAETLAGKVLFLSEGWDREAQRFLGASLLVAAAISLRRRLRPAGGTPLLACAACAFLLSLGPRLFLGPLTSHAWVPGPYALLARLPGYASLRVPSRFAFFVLVALLPFAAAGFASLRRPGRFLLAAFLLVETWAFPLSLTRVATPAHLPPGVAAAAKTPPDFVLAEAPVESEADEARAVYHALFHNHRVANGFASFWTARNEVARRALRAYPAGGARAVLLELGVSAVFRPEAARVERLRR